MEEVKQLIDSLGAIAELAAVFYRDLLAQGLSRWEARELTAMFVREVMYGDRSQHPDS